MFDYEIKHLDTLRPLLAECTVLLKSDGSFPLIKAGTIAAYGSGVRHTVKGGTGSGEVKTRFAVSIEKGLEDAGFKLTSKDWLDGYDAIRETSFKQFIEDIKADAKSQKKPAVLVGMGAVMPEPEFSSPLNYESESALYVISRISGEGNDRKITKGDVLLTDSEVHDILTLNEEYRKFMLVINAGGPVDLSPVMDVRNILVLSQLGAETGTALADILVGKYTPSGKLATTWPCLDQCRFSDFGNETDTFYREGIYVGYRYYDTAGQKPAFPFGFGLSYTKFSTDEAAVSMEGEEIDVRCTISNIGDYPGKETLQLYISAPQGRLDKPYQELIGFTKSTLLMPGESKEIHIRANLSDIACFDEENTCWLLEKGSYVLRLGTCSTNTSAIAVLELKSDVVTEKVRSIGGADFAEEHIDHSRRSEDTEGIPVIEIDLKSFNTRHIEYAKPPFIDDKARSLSNRQLALMVNGSFGSGAGSFSIVGNAGKKVCGAAGETRELDGIPSVVMPDGPAGLRLTPEYYRDAKGTHSLSSGVPESMQPFLSGPLKLLLGANPSGKKSAGKHQTEYQYCTSVPVGTAIAQSWNVDLAQACGDIVGAEMERFGVDLWLAPALNIHRNILCGRNYEYYSEDPIVSGKIAAAVVRGVQKHAGRGAVIKHFAANNQETNRMFSNSMIRERALREIYLKGFQICIRESRPAAVMTSYNLLNGTHTSEHKGLMDYLRCECSYDGPVMTDWLVRLIKGKGQKYPNADAEKIIDAGGDLIMPGSKSDYKAVFRALETGELKREAAEAAVSRILALTTNRGTD